MALVETSQVNEAYRRFFRRLFDASEIREWATWGDLYSGEFTAIHGRTASCVGGTVGSVVGGIAGFTLGLGFTIMCFGGSAGGTAGAVVVTIGVPTAGLGYLGGLAGAVGGYVGQIAVVGPLAAITYVPARAIEASVHGVRRVSRNIRMRKELEADFQAQHNSLSRSLVLPATHTYDRLEPCQLDVPIVFSLVSELENSPVELVAALYMANGAFGGVVWQGQPSIGDAIRYSRVVEGSTTSVSLFIDWPAMPPLVHRVVVCAASNTKPLSQCNAKFGALPLAESRVIAEAEEFSLCPNEVQDKLIVRFTVYNVVSKTSLSIKCKLGETVMQLKERLSGRFVFGIPIAQQNLVFGARILEDSQTLRASGIFFGAMVQLVTNQSRELTAQELEALENELPAGFTGRFVMLDSVGIGAANWYIGASVLRQQENPTQWMLKPEGKPVTGTQLEDVLPALASTIAQHNVEISDNTELMVECAGEFVVDLLGLDRFYQVFPICSVHSTDRTARISLSTLKSQPHELCDVVVVLRTAEARTGEENSIPETCRATFVASGADNRDDFITFTTFETTQFLTIMTRRTDMCMTPLLLTCAEQNLAPFLDLVFCRNRPASVAIAAHHLSMTPEFRTKYRGKRLRLVITTCDQPRQVDLNEADEGEIRAAMQWSLSPNWLAQPTVHFRLVEVHTLFYKTIAECQYDMAKYALPFDGTIKMFNRDFVDLAISIRMMNYAAAQSAVVIPDQTAPDTQLECPVCGDSFAVRDMLAMIPCGHAFCNSCIVSQLTASISDGNVRSIRCLAPDCMSEFTVEQIKRLLPEELFMQYQEFAFNTALASRPGVVWCPRAACGIVMFGNPDRPIMVCPACQYTYCYHCKREWHADMTCDEFTAIQDDLVEQRYQQWVQDHAKPCPSCHANIEKNGGCNHMTCVACRHQFCWLCMEPFASGHFSEGGPCSGRQFT